MRFKDAARLHNGDEVTDKVSGEVAKVLKVTPRLPAGPGLFPRRATVFIEAVMPGGSWQEFMHTEVR